jgi:hypothetical protein
MQKRGLVEDKNADSVCTRKGISIKDCMGIEGGVQVRYYLVKTEFKPNAFITNVCNLKNHGSL